MPHPTRFIPALLGILMLGLMLIGPGSPQSNLCRVMPKLDTLPQLCSFGQLWLVTGIAAIAMIAISLVLISNWQRDRPRAISYESDAGRWILIGWVLAIGGAVALLAGLALIGSGGWPLSQQSRYISTKTGQLPIIISTVQRRYLANYSGTGPLAICAGFGEVTIRNLSSHRPMALDLNLLVTPRDAGASALLTNIPDRADLNAIARRGMTPQSLFRNPVELAPREELRRELVFVIRFADGARQSSVSDRDYSFVLEVRDRLSGNQISMFLPAEYRG